MGPETADCSSWSECSATVVFRLVKAKMEHLTLYKHTHPMKGIQPTKADIMTNEALCSAFCNG